jgi:hypothetical protein
MWSGPSTPAPQNICREPRPSAAHLAPFDPSAAASAAQDADLARTTHVRELRQRAECFRAANGFTICVARATAQFAGLAFGDARGLYHRYPASTSRDGTTRLYGLHDPSIAANKRPYSDCALNPAHEPATQGCLSVRDEQVALQCGDGLIELERMGDDALHPWIEQVPLRYMPLRHTIVSLGELPDGALLYRDRLVIPAAYGAGELDLIFARERLALIDPWSGEPEWLDPRVGCLLCEQATPITDPARIDALRAQLPEVKIGWPEAPPTPWAGECAFYEAMR